MPNKTELTMQVETLENNIDNLAAKDRNFARSLCDQYHRRGLTEKQVYWVGKMLEQIGETQPGSTKGSYDDGVEEIFNGHAIRNLLSHAAEKLLYPRLQYRTDKGSKVVFGYASEGKWAGCVFISNGASAQSGGKRRYGFISKFGNGKLDRTSDPDIKTLIRKVAENPTVEAKVQGQKYSSCCFCGLQLTNKSSLHHGYGPICAGKWNLPWGDTGDLADEEAAAKAELAHLNLQDLEGSE